jgi:hypothetical protein
VPSVGDEFVDDAAADEAPCPGDECGLHLTV